MTQFVRVTDDEAEEAIEIPTEDDNGEIDGTLLLSSLIAQFPGACGLKYRAEDTGSLRGVRLADGVLYPPNGFWGATTYLVNYPKESKRKGDEELDNPVLTKIKKVETRKCSDLIVLGLPWKSTEEDMREYFKQFGELILVQVKRDPRTSQSKGFGFIRFKEYESQLLCLAARHKIGGRWCEVNLPNSHGDSGNTPTNRKIFVARCTEDLTTDDLRDYFEQFGEVMDVFIPKPFRAFAFVTFADPLVADKLCGEDHIIKGASVHISSAEPKGKDRDGHSDRFGSNRGGNMKMSRRDDNNWGGGGVMRQNEPMGMNVPDNISNIGMNVLSTAMLAAAQAVMQGSSSQNPSDSYQLGPGFGGTRDSRSGTQSNAAYSNTGASNTWGSGTGTGDQSGYSQWGNRQYSNPQWGQGSSSSRGGWN